MKNISFIKDCYGCGVCAIACPKHIIEISLNSDGFYHPVIKEQQQCIACAICLDVCAFNDTKVNVAATDFSTESYASWSKDAAIHFACSSGGIGYELGKKAIKEGYTACGVKYNAETKRAEHFVTNNEDEYRQSIGSKYIQSNTIPGFSLLNKKEKFFVVGTPCQIDALRRYTKRFKCEDHYLFADFYCHGVPSMLLWEKYLKDYSPINIKPTEVSWREKTYGWHDSWVMRLKGKGDSFFSKLSEGDLFYKYFLENKCLNKACYHHCKYKLTNSAADIRIGDLWGEVYQKDTKGVNALLILSSKGKDFIKSLSTIVTIPHPLSVVQEGQMAHSPICDQKRRLFNLYLLKTSLNLKTIDQINRIFDCTESYWNRLTRLFKIQLWIRK